MSLGAQFLAFLTAVGIGIGAGFIFDCYRAVHLGRRLGRVATGVGDLLIWLVLAVVVFALLLLTNWGEVRWYIVLGLGVGALLYHRTASRRGVAFWNAGFRLAGRGGRLLAAPAVFAWRLTTRPCRIVVRAAGRLGAGFGRPKPTPRSGDVEPPPGGGS